MIRTLHKETKGFTVIELMVVIAIIGVIIGLSIPALQAGRRREAVRAAAREMAADMKYAQQLAIAQSVRDGGSSVQKVGVRMDGSSYEIFDDVDGDGVRGAGDDIIERVVMPANVSYTLRSRFGQTLNLAHMFFGRAGDDAVQAGEPYCTEGSLGCNTGTVRITFITDAIDGYSKTMTVQTNGLIEVE